MQFSDFRLSASSQALEDVFAEHSVGQFWVGCGGLVFRKGEEQSFDVTRQHVSAAFVGRSDNSDGWSLGIRWKTMDGRLSHKLFSLSRLSSDWPSLLAEFADEGLLSQNPTLLRNYFSLAFSDPELPKVRLVRELGFVSLAASNVPSAYGYAMPMGVILPDGVVPEEDCLFVPHVRSPIFDAHHSKGTLAGWQDAVRPLAESSLVVFTLCVAMAAQMLELAGAENFGVHLYGPSTMGKSSTGTIAMSILGNSTRTSGTRRPSLFQGWAATPNGLEAAFAAASGGAIFLDELGALPLNQPIPVYFLQGGVGKTRMTANGALRARHVWRNLLISTGEISVADRIAAEPSRQAMAGELVRVLSIPIADLVRQPQSAAQLFDTALAGVAENYGTAWPAFVRYLQRTYPVMADLRDQIATRWEASYNDLLTELGRESPLQGLHKRGVRHLALILLVGKMAAEEVLPFDEETIVRSVQDVARAWFLDFPLVTDDDKIVNSIRGYIRGHVFDVIDTARVTESDVQRDLSRRQFPGSPPGLVLHRGYFWLSERHFAQACGDFKPVQAGKILHRIGVLFRHNGDAQHKTKMTFWPTIFQGVRAYALKSDAFFTDTDLQQLLSQQDPGEEPGMETI